MTNNITKNKIKFTKYIVFDSEDEIYMKFTNYGEALEYFETISEFYKDREFYLYSVIHEPIRQTCNKYPTKVYSDGNVLYD